MYSTTKEISNLTLMMEKVQKGTVSRNKNFLIKSNPEEYSYYKRARLFISLIKDLEETSQLAGYKIWVLPYLKNTQINLYNPKLKYKRKVVLTKEELDLINSQSNILAKLNGK